MNSASSHPSRTERRSPSAGGVCGDVVGQRVAWTAVLRVRQGDQLIVDPGRQSNLPYW